MTADYISKKCGSVTIRTDSSSMPQQPLFSPVYSSTRPYSIMRSSTQRALMMPDELLQLDNSKCIVLPRGQKPLRLTKITPEEMPAFARLKPSRVVDYIPAWREAEAEYERQRQQAIENETKEAAMRKAAAQEIYTPSGSGRKSAAKANIHTPGQQSFWDGAGAGADESPGIADKAKQRGGEVMEARFAPVGPDQLTVDEFMQGLNSQRQHDSGGEYADSRE